MIFKETKHNPDLYNTLLTLSRNIFFYKDLEFKDIYETRIYLMFFHYSIILMISKIKGKRPDQNNYNSLFFYIENNLRELGFGDVSVNKRMKELNKVLYDILLKINKSKIDSFELSEMLISKYFQDLTGINNVKYQEFERYFKNFYDFCFELSPDSMLREAINFK